MPPIPAHFAIGSGTKLAIDDAIELANQFQKLGHDTDKIPDVLETYERSAASMSPASRMRPATPWNGLKWSAPAMRTRCRPEQFMYSMLTRSQRISTRICACATRTWLEGYERWFAEQYGVAPARTAR